MTIPFVPHAFVDGDNLDLEKVNDNLEAIARDLARNNAARYTYGPPAFFSLDGVTAAAAAALRQFPVRRPAVDRGVEVVGVEVVIYGSGATGTATLSCSDTTVPDIEIDLVNDATVECTASSGVPLSIPSDVSDVVWTLTLPAAYTVSAGQIVLHTRCDRFQQDAPLVEYTPTLLSTASVDPAALILSELQSAENAIAGDLVADSDSRCEIVVVRSLAAGSSRTWTLPSGARKILAVRLYVVAPVGCTGAVALSGDITLINASVAGTGSTNRVTTSASAGADATQDDDPMDFSDDLLATLSASGAGTADLIAAFIWWE